MGSTFFGLHIGQTGLYAYQAALNTTAHNISNSETAGYTRQVMGMKAGKALKLNSSYGMAGTGVSIIGVEQLRDEYYDIKFWENNTMFGEYSSKSHYMTEIENFFNEVSVEGFTTTFNSMYDSLQELADNPSSLTVRRQVINYGKSFAEYFNTLSENLKNIQEECNFEIRNMVDQVNSTAQQIAALTKQINTLEVGGGSANDLRDQRALLVDELSGIAKISVTEKVVGEGIGLTSYVIKMDGQTLVDGGNYNLLKVVPRQHRQNQNDLEGLYDVTWENGQTFNLGSDTLGGAFQALYEIRDGNNSHNLRGTVSATAGDNSVTVTAATINDMEKLNIPESGILIIGNMEYTYSGFRAERDADGNLNYTFSLTDEIVTTVADTTASIGKSINYKGIPYYQDQMNEFIRTYSKAFNTIHRNGIDLMGNTGIDFFGATHKVTGRNYLFDPSVLDTTDTQTVIPDDQPLYGSYYFMTAENFTVSSQLLEDPNYFAAAYDIVNGVEDNDAVEDLIALKTDKSMFKQGVPGGFMHTLVADIGIDTKKANEFSESQDNILRAITNQRLSVSGVDVDEEAMNLVRYQNAYNLSAKVISVMDEIYERLINYMGV